VQKVIDPSIQGSGKPSLEKRSPPMAPRASARANFPNGKFLKEASLRMVKWDLRRFTAGVWLGRGMPVGAAVVQW
jgi:hypothetical protein